MKTFFENISKLFILIVLFLLFSIMGCSDDPSSPPEEEYKPTTSATIGSSGGTVGNDDILITVPAGAFSLETEIAIFNDPYETAFGENAVSNYYKITGIPDDYSKPIKLKMKYSGDLSEQSYLAVGSKSYDLVNGDSSIVHELYTASDSSGYLISELPVYNNLSLPKSSVTSGSHGIFDEVYVNLASGYKTKITQNFNIQYPGSTEQYVEVAEEIFEGALNIIRSDLEVNYFPNDTKGFVVIKVQEKPVKGKYELHQIAKSLFNVSLEAIITDVVSNGDLRYRTAGSLLERELWYRATQTNSSAAIWYIYAVYSWMEELFTSDSNYKNPKSFPEYAITPFNGLRADKGENSEANFDLNLQHGIGMSSVIKYLTDDERYGKVGIGKTFGGVSQSVLTTASLLNSMDALLADWWPDFLKEYVGGNIYDVPIGYFLDNKSQSWEINSIEDTSRLFSITYPDLSAKMFEINLNYQPPDTSYKMLLSMDAPSGLDGLALIMFGIKNGEPEYLETAHAQDFEIPNLKSYYDDGMTQFLAVLVNCLVTSDDYLGESDIDLTIKIKRKMDYNVCNAIMAIPIEMRTYNPDTGEESFSTQTGLPNTNPKAIGSFDGNTWTGYFNEDGWSGQLVATLNENYTMVTNMDFTYQYNDERDKFTMGYSFTNIPIHPWDPGLYILYYRDDPNLCSHVSNVVYNSQSGSVSRTLYSGPNCDDDSWAYIRFGNE